MKASALSSLMTVRRKSSMKSFYYSIRSLKRRDLVYTKKELEGEEELIYVLRTGRNQPRLPSL